MKNKKMILIFSHRLTNEQIKDAEDNFGISKFVYLDDSLQKIWSNISPDITSLKDILNPIKEFIKKISNKDDVVLIQGDFGACYMLVNFCNKLKLKTIYATTKREIKEYNENNKLIKQSIFKHRRFRKYGY